MFCPNCNSQVPNGAPYCEKCGVQFKAAPAPKKRSSGGGGGGGGSRGGAAPPSYLVLSILATMFCCLPTGIVAIIKSAQVGGAVARGDYNAAQEASSAAMKWCVISFVLAALYLLFSWIMIVTQAEAGGGAGV
ncbi:MAG: CD225/dispanin family protein [Thermoguttaceae bacterium]|nr:CD225/dispanin family protein [Thermoguttaceae bacterium]MBR4105412.1 CD225/dispanin family protein [Thermoguttaceae bacterium]